MNIESLNVSFGGLQALLNVNMEVEKEQILAIIGPNGAGKTTLVNCISGLYNYNGEINFKGRPLSRLRPHEISKLGIARTFQNIELFEHATVLQNLMVGRFSNRNTNFISEMLFLPNTLRQELNDRRKVEEIIDLLEIEPYRDQVVATLPYGIQKLVEIGRALATDPELLILDEPASGLNIDETEDLMWWITDVNEEFGVTIILIEHDMRVVMRISNRICVLDQGAVIASGGPDEVMNNPKVKAAYLGEE